MRFTTDPNAFPSPGNYAITASYALGPGIQVDGVLEYDTENTDEGNVGVTNGGLVKFGDYSGFTIGLGTLINF